MTDVYDEDSDLDARPELRLVPPAATVATVMDAFARLRSENSRALDVLAARLGITATDIRALFFIGTADDITPKRVAEHLGLTTGAMTSLVDRIERIGLVERRPHPTDRRSLLLHATPAGRAAAGSAGHLYITAFGAALEGEDLDAAARLFGRLADELSAGADEIVAGL